MPLPPEIAQDFHRVGQASIYAAVVVAFPDEGMDVIAYDVGDPLAHLEEAIRRSGRPIGIFAIRDAPHVRGESVISFMAPSGWPRRPDFETVRALVRDFILDFARGRGITAHEILPERN